MANLFGLDIAGIVNSAINSAGGLLNGTLENREGNTFTLSGFLERKQVRRPDTMITEPVAVLFILGASLPSGIIPKVNDKVTIDGKSWILLELLKVDPAKTLYEFMVK